MTELDSEPDPDQDAPLTPADPLNRSERMDLIKTVLRGNFEMIRLADAKARLLLRVTMTLFGVAFIGVPPTVAALKRFAAGGSWQLMVFILVVGLYIVCSVCLIVSIGKVLRVIRPKVIPHEMRASLFFYHSITGMDPETFRRTMREINFDQAMDEMLLQLHQTAHLTAAKYRSLNDAVRWMLGGGLFGVLFALILLVSMGLMGSGGF